jgi:hypothetical protein
LGSIPDSALVSFFLHFCFKRPKCCSLGKSFFLLVFFSWGGLSERGKAERH